MEKNKKTRAEIRVEKQWVARCLFDNSHPKQWKKDHQESFLDTEFGDQGGIL